MAGKKKVFISFDYDNDLKLKNFMIGQAKLTDSPFQIEDWSLKEAAPEKDWEKKAETKIKKSEVVIVMVGPKTHKASGVLKEVAIAKKHSKKVVQIIGYKNGDYTRVPNAGILYKWDWENLKKVLK